MKLTKSLPICAAFALCSVHASLAADEVTDLLDESIKFYNEGAYTETTENLNYVLQLIKQKKGGALSGLLPEPLDGWTAEDAESQAAGSGMFGGGVSASRSYKKGDANVNISIMSDSPVLQGMMMMFSNPMFAGADGGKLERINRQKAIVKYNKPDQSGEITLAIASRFLVQIEGSNLPKGKGLEVLRSYAKGIDYKKIIALP